MIVAITRYPVLYKGELTNVVEGVDMELRDGFVIVGDLTGGDLTGYDMESVAYGNAVVISAMNVISITGNYEEGELQYV